MADWNIFKIPSLRHVSLDISADLLSLPLPWEHLSDLTIGYWALVEGIGGGLRLNDAFQLLYRCKNLVRCSLSITHSGRLLPRPASALPSLQSLSLILDEDIIFDKVTDLPEFMQDLSLPNLHHLAFLHYKGEDAPPAPPIDIHHSLLCSSCHTSRSPVCYFFSAPFPGSPSCNWLGIARTWSTTFSFLTSRQLLSNRLAISALC